MTRLKNMQDVTCCQSSFDGTSPVMFDVNISCATISMRKDDEPLEYTVCEQEYTQLSNSRAEHLGYNGFKNLSRGYN